MGEVDDNPCFLQGVEQGFAAFQQATLGARAVAVGTDAVVGNTDNAEPQIVPFGNLGGVQDRVGAFHCHHQADGRVGGGVFPGGDGFVHVPRITDETNYAFAFHRLIIGQVAPAHAVALFLAVHARPGPAVVGVGAGHHRSEYDADVSPAKFRKGYGTTSEAAHYGFGVVDADRRCRLREVPVDLYGAEPQVQVAVCDKIRTV